MRIMKPLVLVLTAALVPAAQGAAQTCLGSNSFANGRMALGVQGGFSSGAKRFGAIGAYGAPKSWYADVTVGSTSYDAAGSKSVVDFGGSLGYQFGLGDSPAELCPYAFVGYSSSSGVKTTNYGFGGSIGWRADLSDDVNIVPAVALQWHGVNTSIDVAGASISGSGSNVEYGANVGFIFNKQWAIVPGVIQSSASGAKAMFTVTLAYFWGK
ncbi:MAG TPA: outer membrane beta-barrel protein [Gemmatimonadaceae bacterium]|nr:outer membrane beta-barrel protein [Gemmatimonadaceae bacterium]